MTDPSKDVPSQKDWDNRDATVSVRSMKIEHEYDCEKNVFRTTAKWLAPRRLSQIKPGGGTGC